MQYSRRSIPSFIVSVCALLVLSVGSSAVRLQISDKECFRENIAIAQSQITLTVVSDDLHGKPVYFDVMVCFLRCLLAVALDCCGTVFFCQMASQSRLHRKNAKFHAPLGR